MPETFPSGILERLVPLQLEVNKRHRLRFDEVMFALACPSLWRLIRRCPEALGS